MTQSNQDDVATFMKGLGATYNRDGSYYKDGRAIDDKEAQFWYTTLQQSNRQLLDEVEAAGPRDRRLATRAEFDRMGPIQAAQLKADIEFNEANQVWHQAIQAIKERRGL